jgi:hypothetical protein
MAALGIGTLVGYLLTKASYPLRLPWLRIGKAAFATTVAGASGWFISFDPPVLALLLKLVLLPSIITLLLLVTGFLSEAERQAALRRLGRLFGKAGRALG